MSESEDCFSGRDLALQALNSSPPYNSVRFLLRFFVLVLLLPTASWAGSVIFTEVMYHPLGAKPEYIEITNLTSNRIDMAKWKLTGGIDYTFPDFLATATSAHLLKEYERIVVSNADEATTRAAWPAIPPTVRVFGPWTGSLNNAGDGISLRDAVSAVQSTLNYSDNGDWPVSADGAGHSLQIINQNGNVDDWRNWRASRFAGGTPGVAEPALVETPTASADKPDQAVVDYTSSWKYWRAPGDPDGADPAAEGSWFSTGYAETDWQGPSPGFFGRDPNNAALQAALGTSFNTGFANTTVAYYFRTTFTWPGPATGVKFAVDQWVDDGVVYYLNGQELKGPNLGRTRMQAGPTTHTTLASGTPLGGDAAEELNALSGTLDGQLVAGVNVLCAEVHQNNTVGDDIYFGARLRLTPPALPGVMINEVKPAAVAGAGFVEFYNPTAEPVDLNGYYLSDVESNLKKTHISLPGPIPAGGYAVLGFSESGLSTASPVTVLLTKPDGLTRQSGFRSAMVVNGSSTARQPSGSSTWANFFQPTPGAANVSVPKPSVVLSEVTFALTGATEFVEVYNTGTAEQPLDGVFLSTKPDLSDRVALSGTVPAGGYASNPVAFPTDASGRLNLYLSDRTNTILSTATLRRSRGMLSHQTWPAGSAEWFVTPTGSRDAANNPERHAEIVINEIMFRLPSGHDDGEYIELYNNGTGPVSMGGWKFTDGISYTFPQNTVLPAGGYLVLASKPEYMRANYAAIERLYGPFSGTLKSSGEKIRLEDERANLADLVDYKQGGQWPVGTGGEGSSLELIHPSMDNSLPSSWRASNETAKSTFQPYTHTGVYKELRGIPSDVASSRELLLNLAGDGYMILRNLKLSKATTPTVNQIRGGDATSHNGTGVNGFLCTGTHCDSDSIPRAATPVRYNALLTADPGFHLISQGTGDTKANLAQVDVLGIAPNDTLTLSFEARWVYGIPVMIAQTWDRSFGKVFHFPVPGNLGTPGAANSRLIPAPAPTVDNMSHFPVVPTSTQPVVVTARVTAAEALASVTLMQRLDSTGGNAAWIPLPMNDAGTDGDALAGDGLYSATVPVRSNGSVTQFYIKTAAVNGQENECPRDGARRPGMWIVANTPPSSVPGILVERAIISLKDRNLLNPGTGYSSTFDFDHPRMSNYGMNSTMIFNESDVYYNCELRRGGSPWTRIGSNLLDRTRWKPPGDQLFRERGKSGVDNDATNTNTGTSRFHNRIVRYMMYLLGHPVPDSEFIQQIVNTDASRIGDEQEQTDTDFFDRAYPNGANGELFEIDDAWFMYDSNNMDDRLSADSVTGRWELRDWANSAVLPFPNDESPIFYHGNWPIRFPEDRYDYAALSSMIKTVVNGNSAVTVAQDASYKERMERVLNIDKAAIYAAVRGYAGDWDNFTLNRGKNGYFYRRPDDSRFEFHHWDSDLAFQNTGEVFLGTAAGVGWTNLTGRPWFRQRYNYYLSALVDRFANASSARMNSWLAAMNYQSANVNALAPFKTNSFNYASAWFTQRNPNATAFIGSTNYNRIFSINTANNQVVTNPVFSLTGVASSKVNYVEVIGHPEAVLTWASTASNPGVWVLSNISLASGVNSLTARTVLHDGSFVGSVVINVTLTGDAPPIPSLSVSPASGNVAIGETLDLDATGSRDPENLPLSYTWAMSPAAGVSFTQSQPGLASARFSIPGNYTLTLSVKDGAGQTVPLVKEFTVFNSADFSSFGGTVPLGPEFTLTNVEHRDNFSPSTWYSVEDVSGRIMVQVLEDSAKPLASPDFTHPYISRLLPPTANFILQTDFRPDTREFGNWRAGLMIQLKNGSSTVRYALGVDGGLNLLVQRSALPEAWTTLSTTPVTGSGAGLRILRLGDALVFQSRTATGWTTAFTETLTAGNLAENGGLYVATSQATSVRIGFDYLLLADPSASNSVLNNLRITEINYRPAAGGVEFIELCNTGSQPIDLNGVTFGQGQPFSMAGSPARPYTFGSEILAPGGYLTLTDNVSLFRSLYGTGPRLAPPWTNGSLSNSGERIVLLDAGGNTVQDFSYGVAAPWPLAANGAGASLEVISTQGDYGNGTNWKASAVQGGTPGGPPTGADTDGDGVPDAVEALFGTNPNSPGSVPAAALTPGSNGTMTLTWPSVPGVIYKVETALSLGQWQIVQTLSGVGSWTFIPAAGEPRRYYRISASLP